MKTVYLADEIVAWLAEHLKPKAVSHPKVFPMIFLAWSVSYPGFRKSVNARLQ
jgi:hypothetical protein